MAERQRRCLHRRSLNHPARPVTMRRKPGGKTESKLQRLKKEMYHGGCAGSRQLNVLLSSMPRMTSTHGTRPDRVRCHRPPTSFVASETTVDVQANPARRVLRVPPQTNASLSVSKKTWQFQSNRLLCSGSTAAEVPHPKLNQITPPARFQAPGVPSGKFRNVFQKSEVIHELFPDQNQTAVDFFAA